MFITEVFVRTCCMKLHISIAIYVGSGTVPHHLRSLLASHAGTWPPCYGWHREQSVEELLCTRYRSADGFQYRMGPCAFSEQVFDPPGNTFTEAGK